MFFNNTILFQTQGVEKRFLRTVFFMQIARSTFSRNMHYSWPLQIIISNSMVRFRNLAFTAMLGHSSLLCQSQNDSTIQKQHFELSFGHSLLFVSESKQIDIREESAVVLPTSAILFFAEFRPNKKLRIPTFFALPTESKQFLRNGELLNERASPTLGIGPAFKLFQIRIDDRSRIEFEISPLTSMLFSTRGKLKMVPVLAGRCRIRRGENFVMYLGASYSAGVNAVGLLYGTGSIF